MQSKLVRMTRAVVGIIFLYILYLLYAFFYLSVVPANTNTAVKIYPGQQFDLVLESLNQQRLLQPPPFTGWIFQYAGSHLRLQYGEYKIQYPMTASTLFRHFIRGTGLVKHRLTIVNGWTFSDIRNAILSDTNFTQNATLQTNAQIMQSLNTPEKNPEGLFYPDTYFFTWKNTDISILKKSYQKMQMILNTEWNNRAPNLPYQNAYQALIAASLIERETSVNAEKPLIASVILNRMAKHMRLQIDPTVQYGADKSYGDVITKKELATSNPYNTYRIYGLPPSPICMPSQSSIHAALHPAPTHYLYYVATGTGGHHFSATYEEHLQEVSQYQQTIRQKKP